MNTKILRAGMAVGVLACGAGADVISFDDIEGVTTRESFRDLGIEQSYAGLEWLSTTDLSWSEEGLWFAGNIGDSQIGTVGAHSGDQVAWNGYGGLAMSVEFDVPSTVDGAWFNVLMAGADWGADRVRMEGYDAQGGFIDASDWVSLDDDSESPDWLWVDASLPNVSTLTIRVEQDDVAWEGAGWFVMDDLTINTIPAPASLAVFGLVLLRRRRD